MRHVWVHVYQSATDSAALGRPLKVSDSVRDGAPDACGHLGIVFADALRDALAGLLLTCSPLLVQLFPDSCSSGGGKRSDAALVLVGPRSGGAALQ
jgi:hypothetical protein